MKALLIAALTTFSIVAVPAAYAAKPGTATAPNAEWILITQNSDDTIFYSGKRGSFELTTTKSGSAVAVILGQIEHRKENSLSYGKWYVSTADCDAGLGKLVVLRVNGDFDFESDFVAKGNNIASGIADVICGLYRSDVQEKRGKGI